MMKPFSHRVSVTYSLPSDVSNTNQTDMVPVTASNDSEAISLARDFILAKYPEADILSASV